MAKGFVHLFAVVFLACAGSIESKMPLAELKSTFNAYFIADLYRNARLFGSQEAVPNEFPFMALVTGVRITPVMEIKVCAGSILSATTILTAASCFYNDAGVSIQSDYQWGIVAGAHDINNAGAGDDSELKDVINILKHPEYNPTTKDNNVAILIVSKIISFGTPKVQPICLTSPDMIVTSGSKLTLSAWGTNLASTPNDYNPLLQKTVVQAECDSYCSAVADTTYNPVTMFCASQSDKGFCFGDIGGPAFHKVDGKFYQVGIMSHQSTCGEVNKPGYYVKISALKPWIQAASGECFVCQ